MHKADVLKPKYVYVCAVLHFIPLHPLYASLCVVILEQLLIGSVCREISSDITATLIKTNTENSPNIFTEP